MKPLAALLLGAIAGGAVAAGAWLWISKQMDKAFEEGSRDLLAQARPAMEREIRQQLQSQIPPLIDRQMTETLNRYGITPQTGAQLSRALTAAERIGLIGLVGAGR